MNGKPDRAGDVLLRLPEVIVQIALSKSTIYARIPKGTFPPAVDLGGGIVRWWQSDISRWKNGLELKVAAREHY